MLPALAAGPYRPCHDRDRRVSGRRSPAPTASPGHRHRRLLAPTRRRVGPARTRRAGGRRGDPLGRLDRPGRAAGSRRRPERGTR
ncbi:hypothetical protein C1I95_19845 [Micromonospora craterilacus]|uniref:Uncharacterized protein n=1 Tax=Micromonospora craterilacus TaxID=1655439 RepID=A0A2W2ESJ4_9ACTN|nr:hypothetical protein C1I95_19845 [Micromonospora craterilacus]